MMRFVMSSSTKHVLTMFFIFVFLASLPFGSNAQFIPQDEVNGRKQIDKKDFNLAKHPEIDVPNLQVIKLMQSFKSREYVRETFAWIHYYWILTNDGIEFVRSYLNLPSEIVTALSG